VQGKVNYTVVGIFVVVLTAVLIIAIFWLSTLGNNKDFRTYLVNVHEDVTGLSVESPVRFNGVKVGYVESIKLDPHNSKLVTLKLQIEPQIVITVNTYAILNEQGITGVIYVNLKSDAENGPVLKALPGQEFPVIPSRPSLLMQLSAVLPEVATEVQNLSKSISGLLNAENRQSIGTTLKNMATITQTLADNSKNFTDTLQLLRNTLTNVSAASVTFPETMASINRLSGQMAATSASIKTTMQSGQNLIRNFSDQVLPDTQQAITNLSHATMGVDELTQQLQRNPSMLIRGKAPAQLGPGEK
jgi:phospholipid/cholesterol/gamma-HCH transport system substrate-binding protein